MVSAKQDALTAGTNITISNNTISATDTNTLSDLIDTAISSLADGQVLKYNATSGKWVNGTGGSGGAEVILGTTAPTAIQGSNGNLYIQYDDTNNNTVTHEYVKISGAWEEIAIGGGGGSTTTVTVTPKVLTGINIADITVGNGNTTDTYDYAYFDGSGYYETPFKVDTDHEYEITFEAIYDDTMAVIGTYAGANYFHLTIYNNYWYVGTNSGEVSPSAYTTGKHTFKTDSSHTYLDDTQFTSYTPAVVNNYITIGARENTYLYKGKFYEFKIKSISTGNVLYDLVPGMRGTTKGLYDLVSDTFVECSFITNMGTKTGTSGGITTQLYAPSIEANPSGTATDSLSSIEIDGTIYSIEGGGGSGTTTEEIYKNTAGTVPDTISLTKPINDFDIILITGFRSNTPTWKISSFYVSSAINQGDVIELNDDAYYAWYTVTDLSTLTKNVVAYDVIDAIYGLKLGSGSGGDASAEEMTLAEYSGLTEQQKNDGTIRFIPAGSGSEALTTVDMTDITVYKEGSMDASAVSSSEIDVTWNGGQQIGCNFDFNTPINVTDYDRITFKVTNGSCYDNGTQAMYPRWNMMIGLMSAPLGELTNIEPTDSRWIVVADMPLSNHVYEETLDVSGLTGNYYIVISAHGWNTTIEDITLRQGGDYPSQIRYMSKTYGISSGSGEGGNPELEETALLTTPITAEGTYTLLDNIEDYDFVSFVSGVSYEADIRLLTVSDMLNMLDDNLIINCAGTGGRWFNITALNGTSITITKASETIIHSIMGYKYKGGSGSSNVIELTQSEYDALPEGEKNNGCIYMVSSQVLVPEELTEAQTSTSTAVTASSYQYDTNLNQYHYPWCAFNRVSPNPNEMAYPTPGVTTQTCWNPNANQDGSDSWICYHFDRAYKMTSMTINSFTDYSSSATKSMVIEGSNDGTTWTNILLTGNSFSLNSDLHTLTPNNVNLNSDTAYEYVRLRSLEPMGASYQPSVFIDEIFVYGYKSEETLKKIYYMGTEYGNTGGGGGGSSSHTYSTTEHIVGTWIDGSDIYEKSFEVTITETMPIIEQDASYIDALISYDAVVKNSLGYISGVGMDAGGWGFALHRNPSAQLLLYGNLSEAIGGKAYVTIRYTKVTQGQN